MVESPIEWVDSVLGEGQRWDCPLRQRWLYSAAAQKFDQLSETIRSSFDPLGRGSNPL